MDKKPPRKRLVIGEKNNYLLIPNSKFIHIVKKGTQSTFFPKINSKPPTITSLGPTSSESTNTSTYEHFNDSLFTKFIRLNEKHKSHNKKNIFRLIKKDNTLMVKQKLNLTVNCSDEVCPTEISNCNNTINVDKNYIGFIKKKTKVIDMKQNVDSTIKEKKKIEEINNERKKSNRKLKIIINNNDVVLNKSIIVNRNLTLNSTNVSFYKGNLGRLFNTNKSVDEHSENDLDLNLDKEMNSFFKRDYRRKLAVPDSYIKYNSYLIRQNRFKDTFINIVKEDIASKISNESNKIKTNNFLLDSKDNYEDTKHKIFIENQITNANEFLIDLSFQATDYEIITCNVDHINHSYYPNSYIVYEMLKSTKCPDETYDSQNVENTLITNFIKNNEKIPTFIFYNTTIIIPKFKGKDKNYLSNFLMRVLQEETKDLANDVKRKKRKTRKKTVNVTIKHSILETLSQNVNKIADQCERKKQFEVTKYKVNNYSLLASKEMYKHIKGRQSKNISKVLMNEIKKKEKESKIKKRQQEENEFLLNAGMNIPSCEYSMIKTQEMSEFQPGTKKLSKFITLIQQGKTNSFIENFSKTLNIIDSKDKDNGNTLLIWAVKNNNKELVQFLIENGAEVNLANDYGNTPLHFAFSNKNYEIVNILLKNNASEETKNLKGLSPWECVDNMCD